MMRTIEGWHQDDEGDWVAELSCLHHQHVRHRPPFWERPWALTRSGRDARLGSQLDCPLCDRAELPPGLATARTAGPFDADTLPPGLRREHRVAEHTWGVLRVLDGAVVFTMATEPPMSARLQAGDTRAIPPGVPHALRIDEPVRLAVDFMVRAEPDRPSASPTAP